MVSFVLKETFLPCLAAGGVDSLCYKLFSSMLRNSPLGGIKLEVEVAAPVRLNVFCDDLDSVSLLTYRQAC